jgi:coenzyme PQQ precursor peptide PqqA
VASNDHGTPIASSTYEITTPINTDEEQTMAWETPAYSDVRFGFEVTMYINNR